MYSTWLLYSRKYSSHKEIYFCYYIFDLFLITSTATKSFYVKILRMVANVFLCCNDNTSTFLLKNSFMIFFFYFALLILKCELRSFLRLIVINTDCVNIIINVQYFIIIQHKYNRQRKLIVFYYTLDLFLITSTTTKSLFSQYF